MSIKLFFKKLMSLFKFEKKNNDIFEIGYNIIVEGGPATGKSSFLQSSFMKLNQNGFDVIYIKGNLPLYNWFDVHKFYGSNLNKRLNYFLSTLPSNFYLIVDDVDKVQDSRKLEVLLFLLSKACNFIFGCSSFNNINQKLKSRLKVFNFHCLGYGGETFDITYFIIAFIIVIIAVIGAINLIFLAAALRYIFIGSRIGGRK